MEIKVKSRINGQAMNRHWVDNLEQVRLAGIPSACVSTALLAMATDLSYLIVTFSHVVYRQFISVKVPAQAWLYVSMLSLPRCLGLIAGAMLVADTLAQSSAQLAPVCFLLLLCPNRQCSSKWPTLPARTVMMSAT